MAPIEISDTERTIGVDSTAGIAAARRFAVAALADVLDGDRLDDVALVVSELVTNALEHGDGGTVDVTVGVDPGVGPGVEPAGGVDGERHHRRHDEHVRAAAYVTVSSPAPALPAPQRPAPSEPSGRGLLITAGLSDRVDVRGRDARIEVSAWFTLPAR